MMRVLNVKQSIGLSTVVRQEERKRDIMHGDATCGFAVGFAMVSMPVQGKHGSVAVNHLR